MAERRAYSVNSIWYLGVGGAFLDGGPYLRFVGRPRDKGLAVCGNVPHKELPQVAQLLRILLDKHVCNDLP